MLKAITLSSVLLFSIQNLFAQLNPVKWSYTSEKVSDQEYDLIITANVDPGWYIYSQYLESDDGPIRTSFNFSENEAFKLMGQTKENGKKKEGFDDLFGMNVIKYSGTTQFVQRIKLSAPLQEVSGYLEFMTCDDDQCLPPKEIDFAIKLQ